MSSKRGGKGQPKGKQYGPKKTPPAQEPPVVLVQVLLPKGEKSGEFERKMRRLDPDFDKKIEIINSIYNDYGVRVNMESFMKNPEKFSIEGVLEPFKNSIKFIKEEIPNFQNEFIQGSQSFTVNLDLNYDKDIFSYVYAQSGPFSGIEFGNLYTSADVKQKYQNNVDSGFHPKGTTFQDVLIHEMGHSIHYVLQNMDYIKKNPNSSYYDFIVNSHKEHAKHTTTNKIVKRALQEMGVKGVTYSNLSNYTKEISGYAKKKYR